MDKPDRLPFVVESRGELRELDLRLHEHTSSRAHVADLVSRLLDVVTEYVDGPREVSDGDVIQSLMLAVALRLDAAGIPPGTARALMSQLSELALESAESASSTPDAKH